MYLELPEIHFLKTDPEPDHLGLKIKGTKILCYIQGGFWSVDSERWCFMWFISEDLLLNLLPHSPHLCFPPEIEIKSD